MNDDRELDQASGQLDSQERLRGAPEASRRYIALRWRLDATYHASWTEAEEALADLPAAQRAAIVDSQTGRTLASQASYPAVEEAVGGEILGVIRRDGPLGDLAGERGRRP